MAVAALGVVEAAVVNVTAAAAAGDAVAIVATTDRRPVKAAMTGDEI